MRDPHTVALHGHVDIGQSLIIHNPQPVEHKTTSFSLRIADSRLRAEIKDDPPTVTDAFRALMRYLRSWEILTNLRYGSEAIRCVVDDAEVINGPPGAGLSDELRRCLAPDGQITLGIAGPQARRLYPDLPSGFVASPDVVSMWERYAGYLAGREPLLSMAYFCLTVIEASTGKRKKEGREAAAERYGVEFDVLSELGKLTSGRGDASAARKVVAGSALQPLSDTEAAWVNEVVKALIHRVGEWAADPNVQWPQITMGDFPRL